jgi:hypothetical protein
MKSLDTISQSATSWAIRAGGSGSEVFDPRYTSFEMSNNDSAAVVVEAVLERDRALFTMGDTLDVKASIVLVLITFLATLTSDILHDHALSAPLRLAQVLSAMLLAAGAICSVASLWPKDFQVETGEGFAEWLQDLRTHYASEPEPDLSVSAAIADGRIARAHERIVHNRALTEWKSQLVFWAFAITATAMVLNLVTLITIAWNYWRPS